MGNPNESFAGICDKIQTFQNTNRTKYNTKIQIKQNTKIPKYKHNEIQKDIIQISKTHMEQNTNGTNYNCSAIQMQQNANAPEY